MKHNNIEFEAIVATPGCGKSYLCDKYPDFFIDVDEERLRKKYFIPEDITRKELEETKGDRPFKRRDDYNENIADLYIQLDKFVKEGKVLIAAPHPETIDYFVKNKIKFCFVYPSIEMQNEIERRMTDRGNSKNFIKENKDMFYEFYKTNLKENKSVVHYQFKENEYLEDIIKKFGFDF